MLVPNVTRRFRHLDDANLRRRGGPDLEISNRVEADLASLKEPRENPLTLPSVPFEVLSSIMQDEGIPGMVVVSVVMVLASFVSSRRSKRMDEPSHTKHTNDKPTPFLHGILVEIPYRRMTFYVFSWLRQKGNSRLPG